MKETRNLREILTDNTALLLFLSACPVLACTAGVLPAAGMAILLLAVRLLTGAALLALGRRVPDAARLVTAIVLAAAFTTAAQMLMGAFLPALIQPMGIYAALAAVDLAVYDELLTDGALRAGDLARSLRRGVKLGVMLLAVAALREALGAGALAGHALPFLGQVCIPLLAKAPGGFLMLGIWAAVCNAVAGKPGRLNAAAPAAAAAAGLARPTQEEEA